MATLPSHIHDTLVKNYLNATETYIFALLNKKFNERFFALSKTKHVREFVENNAEEQCIIPINDSNFHLLCLEKKHRSAIKSLSIVPDSIIAARSHAAFISLAEINWTGGKPKYAGDKGLKILVKCTYPTHHKPMTFQRKRDNHHDYFTKTAQYCIDDERRMLVISHLEFFLDFDQPNLIALFIVTPSLIKKIIQTRYTFTDKPIVYDPLTRSFIVPSKSRKYPFLYNDTSLDLTVKTEYPVEKLIKEEQRSTKRSIGRTIAHKKSQLLQNFRRF
jgi:hypothetical protein